MKKHTKLFFSVFAGVVLVSAASPKEIRKQATVPFVLDHNRMLVEAEMQKKDGTWRKVRLWVDTGNPTFSISEPLARDLGLDLSAAQDPQFKGASLEVPIPPRLRLGEMTLNLDGVKSSVIFQPFWLFSTMHNDGNLPSSVLKKYRVVFDYPKKEMTLAESDGRAARGIKSKASINPDTGIIQLEAKIEGETLSLALDNGASYSFISEETLLKFVEKNPTWPKITGTLGWANMWGWWPNNEQLFPVVRIPEIRWGEETLKGVGMVGVPKFSPNGPSLGEWYSRKTARPVEGFLGPNAFKAFRLEIDYPQNAVYFEKGADFDSNEMEMVGLSVRPLPDGSYQVVGIVQKDGKPGVEGIEPEDIIISIDGVNIKGLTMGKVVDALRGKQGDIRVLLLKRKDQEIKVEAKVKRFLS